MLNMFHLAIQTVEVHEDFKGKAMVIYWSPTIQDYWSTEGLGTREAYRIAEQIKARLALSCRAN